MSSLIADHFDVVLHRTVLEEMCSVLKRAYPKWKDRGLVREDLSEIRRSHAEWTATRCSHENLEGERDLLKAERLNALDKGEIDCIALAKATADKHVNYVVFLTDDYDAGECAKDVFDKYQVGMVVRSADLISFFGIRYKLAKAEIHQGLRNLISFYTNLYESILKEVQVLLPGGDISHVMPLLYGGDFARAMEVVSRLSLNGATRSKLAALIGEVASLATNKSVVAHAIHRLRALDTTQL